MKYIFLLFLFLNLSAQDKYSFRVAYGGAIDSDLSEITSGTSKPYPYNLQVLALDAGYLLCENTFALPIDTYAKTGISYYDEDTKNTYKDDVYELDLYLKAYYNLNFLSNRVRFGLGSGLSYVTDVLYAERDSALASDNHNTSRFLIYLDLSIDIDLGRLIAHKPLYGTTLGYALKHRSGVYGLVNNVTHGGSNYGIIYIESNF